MIRWAYAFLDRPADRFETAAEFWTQATETTLSPRRGENGEFATFQPATGDAFLKLQAVGGPGGGHLDFAVTDVRAFITSALDAGAAMTADHGDWAVLRSPAGHFFCAVPWHEEQTRPAPVTGPSGVRVRADQMCVDALPDGFETEYAFWAAVTGWESQAATLPEFSRVVPPPSLPVRILVQRLGSAADRPAMHLDLACSDVPAAVAWHVSLGAVVLDVRPKWTVMRDPAGGVYCLTSRIP
ncbi:VOC family protein [Hamadaea sp. NPDC051192]|uniref:VOC family protein n=1 Tax=Hamadaea sp. NPDC051192 TaxID=3154940 RepID=UPI0034320E12